MRQANHACVGLESRTKPGPFLASSSFGRPFFSAASSSVDPGRHVPSAVLEFCARRIWRRPRGLHSCWDTHVASRTFCSECFVVLPTTVAPPGREWQLELQVEALFRAACRCALPQCEDAIMTEADAWSRPISERPHASASVMVASSQRAPISRPNRH